MIFACWLAIHTFGAARVDDTVEIPILHRRASVVLAKIEPFQKWDVQLSADDAKGVIVAVGSLNNINSAKQIIAIFDSARRPVTIKVAVDSVADKMSFETTATILNMQEWRTSDAETGVTVSIEPRINDDGTVTLMCNLNSEKSHVEHGISTVMRLKKGASTSFGMSVDGTGFGHLVKAKSTSALEPVVKISVEKL